MHLHLHLFQKINIVHLLHRVSLFFYYIILKLFLFSVAGSIAMSDDGITYLECIDRLSKPQIKQLISGDKKNDLLSYCSFFFRLAFETKTLSIEVNKSEEASKIVYTVPFNSNIWAYHDSRLWLHTDRMTEPTTDLSPALTE